MGVMRQYRSRSAALIGLLLLATLGTGCGDSGSSDGNTAGLEKPKIKVAMLSLINNAPYYIAIKEKLFEKEGLKVETRPVQQSTSAVPSLKNGGIDLVFGNDATFLAGHDSGSLKVRLIVEGTTVTPRFMGVLVMPRSPVKTLGDLAGKSVSVHVLNNIQAITLNAVLKAGGVDPAKIKYKQVIFPQMATALQKGELDAIHVLEPFLTDAQRKLGARLVVDGGGRPVTGLSLDGYFATEEWAAKNPKTAVAFQRAMLKAQALAADRKRVEAILPTYAKGIDPQTTRAMTLPGYPTSVDTGRIQRLIDLMRQQGLLKTQFDARSIVIGGAA